MSNRQVKELQSLCGRESVERAISDRRSLLQWKSQHYQNQIEVIKAMQKLEEVIESPHSAVEYLATLSQQVKGCLILSLISS